MRQKPRTLIVIPAFNESPHVLDIVHEIINKTRLPVLVVDDASTDDTVALAEKAGATVLSLACQLGAWGATQAGIRYAYTNGYQRVVTFDADGQHDVNMIVPLLEYQTDKKADVVIGACTERGSASRKTAWLWLRLLSGLTVEDLTSGFRVYTRPALQLLSKWQATNVDYQDIGILCLLRHAGLRICEFQVCMYARKDGKSRIFNSWLAVSKYMLYSSLLALSHTRYSIGK